MNYQELFAKHSPLVKQNLLALILAALGMMFFAYGLIGLFIGSKTASDDIVFETSSTSTEQDPKEAKTIMVDVEGAVVKSGLYKLPYNSRIQDALVAAGGLGVDADRGYIAKAINLATKLTDGSKLYVPFIGEAVGNAGVLSVSSGNINDNLININTSSQTDLEALPGIGPVTAGKIIAGRPYGSVDELLGKKIVGSKVFGQIKDKITVY